jgi:hypothetical protein
MPTININFDPAAVLYQKKLLLRRRSDLKTDLLELPSFHWRLEKKHQPGMTDKDIVRHWVRYLALALFRMANGGTSDATFVALIEAGATGDCFSLQLYCPYPQLLAPLADRAELTRLMEDASRADLDIRYQFALPGTLCPIAFVYTRATNQVRVTNENQLRDPQQFLDMKRCGTTSGLLNFIGVALMLEAADPAGAHAGRLQQLMQDAIDARRDEWLRWLYHLLDTRVLFEPKRVLVDPQNPESYYYDY